MLVEKKIKSTSPQIWGGFSLKTLALSIRETAEKANGISPFSMIIKGLTSFPIINP